MKKYFLPVMCAAAIAASAQSNHCDSSEGAPFKKNNVEQQWEYKVDKKTKKKTFNAVREFDGKGCISKLILPAENGTYRFNEWEYDPKRLLLAYREGRIDKDSAKTSAYAEEYGYNTAGMVTKYKKDVFETEFSHSNTKWEYDYSDKGERRGFSYAQLRVNKDTISHDEIKYAASGMPIERSVNYYFPKGISHHIKYNSSGLPVDYMRYDKGKVVSHKNYSYTFDNQGQVLEENIVDGIAKTSEKKKYEKDKIIYTKINTKGKVLENSVLPYAALQTYAFPATVVAASMSSAQKKEPARNIIKKERSDKEKNKIIESYIGTKLVSTEIINSKGLLLESSAPESGFVLKYEYRFY